MLASEWMKLSNGGLGPLSLTHPQFRREAQGRYLKTVRARLKFGDFLGGPVADSEFPIQWAQV